jgi:hypothetical protein
MPQRKVKSNSVLIAAVALILFDASQCATRGLSKANGRIDYVAKANKLARAGRAEELNSAPYYKKAFELYVEQPGQLRNLNKRGWPGDLAAKQQKDLQAWIERNSEALRQLKKGAEKPCCWIEYQAESLWHVKLPDLSKVKDLAQLLCHRAKANAASGDLDRAFTDLLVAYRFGMHWTGPKTLIEQLVGLAVRALAVRTGLEILDRTSPAPGLLKRFQHELEQVTAARGQVIDFSIERLMTSEAIRAILTDSNEAGGALGPQQRKTMRDMLSLNEEQLDKVYDYFGQVAHKTPWQLHSHGEDISKVVGELTEGNFFLDTFMPAVGRVVELSYRSKVEADALVTGLSILRYKADKGRPPQKLDQLISTGYLKALPMDPYSGNPLVYKRIRHDFTLYSLGADFDDDGGTPSRWGGGSQGGDMVFWPVERPEGKRN